MNADHMRIVADKGDLYVSIADLTNRLRETAGCWYTAADDGCSCQQPIASAVGEELEAVADALDVAAIAMVVYVPEVPDA